uniref:Probable nicotinate-nucleotide adenylyltransferase n=1 Tax=candidate division WOR-3 bacterium TaxID=2052148 RepID=A0A7C4GHV2_UNCW3
MRIGVFGGSFNPIHLGHLLVADDVLRQLRLDRMLFVPAAVPPHRPDVLVSFEDRLHMVRLALTGSKTAEASAIEGGRQGPSYTVRTLEMLRQRCAGDTLFLVLGADQYAAIHTWQEPDRLARLARIVVISRPGVPRPPLFSGHLPQRVRFLDVVPVDIAAATIRRRASAGRSIRCLVPSAVGVYIRRRRLYHSLTRRSLSGHLMIRSQTTARA